MQTLTFPTAALVCAIAPATAAVAQTTVVSDSFEAGVFDPAWDLTSGNSGVVSAPGDGADGSDHYARVTGTGQGIAGVGVSLVDINPLSPFSTDFAIGLDFRLDSVSAGTRQFSLIGSSGNDQPNTSNATLNLRYQDGGWAAYNGAWQSIPALGAVTPGEWSSLLVTGSNWGSGVAGAATYDIQVTDHLGGVTAANGLQFFQLGDPDTDGARSLSLNDTWGGNPGFDIDNVVISATPAPSPPTIVTQTPVNPVAYSGVYPHTSVTNDHKEVGIGALINRNGEVYYMTYGPHVTQGGSDELYKVDTTTLAHTTYLEYPGGTHANRYTDTHLGIDAIGAAYIDTQDEVRFLPIGSYPNNGLEGRITGTSAHLTDPNKLYYMTMEEGLYEVDFSDLNNPVINELKPDRNNNQSPGDANLPGVHGKGLFTGQGRIYYTNNGNEGVLAEWDGVGDPNVTASWNVVDVNNYTEVTSRRGPVDMSASATDAIWAIGWDDVSMIFNTRDAESGQWTKFRLPKSSYTHDAAPGWFTEWPRVRDVGLDGGFLMSHHGMMFLVPETFAADNAGGLIPLGTHHKMIVDYVEDGDQIVFAANDASKFSNNLALKTNSNLFFLDKADVATYGGSSSGFGGVYLNEDTAANQASDAFFVGGFRGRVLHLSHDSPGDRDFVIEVDPNGTGAWSAFDAVTVGGGDGYAYHVLPRGFDAQWLRVRSTTAADNVTAYTHLSSAPNEADAALTASLAGIGQATARSQGVIRARNTADYELEFAADILDASGAVTETGYYLAQLNADLGIEIVKVDDAAAESTLRTEAATTQDFVIDDASIYIEDDGIRYRLPKSDLAYDTDTASGPRRGVREVVTERSLMNLHGTFYELPRNNSGGIQRIRPITTHNLDIYDYTAWRGLLVLTGVDTASAGDGQVVTSADGKVDLWFGNVDDLWAFGAPVGQGGPWLNDAVNAGQASDPYLMYGYDQKLLELSHTHGQAVDITVEVDVLGDGQWRTFDVLTVGVGEVLSYLFPEDYTAHWVRFTSDTSTTATAWLTYALAATAPSLPGDANNDGVVDLLDFDVLAQNFGANTGNGATDGDFNGDGVVDLLDFDVLAQNFGAASPGTVPEPASALLVGPLLLAVTRRRR